MQAQQSVRLAISGAVNPAGQFEILAITAGVGNGWEFGEACLKESLPLWDGAECFVDHAWFGHSIRDLAGVLHSPEWDAQQSGVRAQLKAIGPSATLLAELGRQMLAEDGPKPRIGFSADVLFTAQGRKVERILRVKSVDLVFDPARGGAFKRALNSTFGVRSQEAHLMETVHNPGQAQPQGVEDPAAAQQEAEETRKLRAQMCACVLVSALAASKLPDCAQQQLRKKFSGAIFEAAELQSAIEDMRDLIGGIHAAGVVQGPGRISGMFSGEDQLTAAVEDLFGVPRSAGLESLHVARLSGIRELYLMLTGDDDLHGGYYPQRVRLATTADFTGLVKNALNKVVVNTWEQLGRAGYNWWERIATVEHFSTLNDITGTLIGTVGPLPAVAEGGEYQPLPIGDSPETAAFTKYGGYIPLSLELIDRDETRKLRAYPRELATAGLRKISELVSGLFTANNGAGPLMADSGNLFNAGAVGAAGGHANLGSAALDAGSWEAACMAVYQQPMLVKNGEVPVEAAPAVSINPRFLLVPRALQLTARKILYPSLENAANITSENQQQGQPGDVITVPEWKDAKDWAAACDPLLAPAVYVGERFGLMPEVFIAGGELSPAVFTNDEHRMKVRHFLAVWVNDYRPLYKANVV